eukprot:6952046-Alexandrium_andersonii.AAC.1
MRRALLQSTLRAANAAQAKCDRRPRALRPVACDRAWKKQSPRPSFSRGVKPSSSKASRALGGVFFTGNAADCSPLSEDNCVHEASHAE